jgi:inhibitor of cysteine peptidase
MRLYGIALIALALLSACYSENVSKIIVTEKDSGTTFIIKKGDTLYIVLEGNITTGYTWEVSSIDQEVIKQVGEPEYKTDSSAIGAGGKISFLFVPVNVGRTSIKLIYHRPWEKDVPAIKTFDITVAVQ